MFTWDQAKRQESLRKHGIDFADMPVLFDGFTLTAEDNRQAYGEQRFVTLGLLHGAVVAVVHTERRGALRIISARKATRYEIHSFFRQVPD
jgi:uncharacterized DUF497 family protein